MGRERGETPPRWATWASVEVQPHTLQRQSPAWCWLLTSLSRLSVLLGDF